MNAKQVRILVENLAERRFIEGIFADELKNQRIRVTDCLLSSAALGLAKRLLLEQPDQPVAVVLNADTDDPMQIEENLGSIQRYLGMVTWKGWHATLVVPRMDAWAMADDRIRRAFEHEPERLGESHYIDRAVEFTKLVQKEPFDREALLQKSEEFRALCEFIREHSAVAEYAAS